MSLFVEYHLIQNFAPSNLNRDDTGAPKDAVFGGHRRARVSSQCQKRSIRREFAKHELIPQGNRGIRTRKLRDLLLKHLSGRDRDEAESRIEAALGAVGLALKDGMTQYLLFLGEQEVAGFAGLIEQHWDDLTVDVGKKSKKDARAAVPAEIVKKAKAILDGGRAVDVALFGRMIADLPEGKQDAACQVAHAISTHRVEREFDYYTAVDDVSEDDETGAGMIGHVEFNSATFYRYAVLDADKMIANLQGERELAISAIGAFTEAIVRAIPTGKQNSFAAHNPPEFIGVSLRRAMPMNLANAFEKPVIARAGESLTGQSVSALADYEAGLAPIYGSPQDQWLYLDLTGRWPKNNGEAQASLSDLAKRVSELVAEYWGD